MPRQFRTWLRWPLRVVVFILVATQVGLALVDGPQLAPQIDLLIVAAVLGACVLAVLAAILDPMAARLAVLEEKLVPADAADEPTVDIPVPPRVCRSPAVGRARVPSSLPSPAGLDPETVAAVVQLRRRLARHR